MAKRKSDLTYQICENFFKKIPGDELLLIGSTYFVLLDDDRRVSIDLHNTWCADELDSIFLKLISKKNGTLTQEVIKFVDVFDSMRDLTHPNKIAKHIWHSDGEWKWYGKPTPDDRAKLNSMVEDYVEMWR